MGPRYSTANAHVSGLHVRGAVVRGVRRFDRHGTGQVDRGSDELLTTHLTSRARCIGLCAHGVPCRCRLTTGGEVNWVSLRPISPTRPAQSSAHGPQRRRGSTWTKKLPQREHLAAIDRGTHVSPSHVTVEQHMTARLAALRKGPTTVESYSKSVRRHVIPYIGDVKLTALTGLRLSALYRTLETSGRRDGRGAGLSARTVRYVHTIVRAALQAAVDENLLAVSPAGKAKPPTAKQAKSPEMRTWDADQLRGFLEWAQPHRADMYPT
jgi:hypothetical protein